MYRAKQAGYPLLGKSKLLFMFIFNFILLYVIGDQNEIQVKKILT